MSGPAAPRRLAVVLSHPTQYYSPWFQRLRRETDLELRVFYLWDFGVSVTRDPQFQREFRWDVNLLEGYESEFVPNRARRPGPESFRGFDNPALAARLESWGPEAVLIYGYRWLSHLRAVAWARRRKVPILFRGDSHRLGRGRPSPAARLLLGALFGRLAAFLYVGQANRDYFKAFGVPERKLFFAPHSVNDRLFDPRSSGTREGAAELRRRLGLGPDRRVVLFAGKLTAAKQPLQLLQAFVELRRGDAALVIAGDGAERPAIEAAAARAPAATVQLLPFANQTEMPARYLMADLFVLPSGGRYETWGLAVNEAMHLGVPALVSDRVGCQRDLVTDGTTGWVFRAGDAGHLRERLGAALDTLADPVGRDRVRAAVAERISGYTYARTTAGLEEALASLPRRG